MEELTRLGRKLAAGAVTTEFPDHAQWRWGSHQHDGRASGERFLDAFWAVNACRVQLPQLSGAFSPRQTYQPLMGSRCVAQHCSSQCSNILYDVRKLNEKLHFQFYFNVKKFPLCIRGNIFLFLRCYLYLLSLWFRWVEASPKLCPSKSGHRGRWHSLRSTIPTAVSRSCENHAITSSLDLYST